MSDPIATKISTVPLTQNNTPQIALCLIDSRDQFDMSTLEKYGLTLEEYMEKGVWETSLTKEAGMSVEDVLVEMVNANFMSVNKTTELSKSFSRNLRSGGFFFY